MDIKLGTRVSVHKNLHRGDWTVSIYLQGRGWRVATNVAAICIRDCSPRCGSTRLIREHNRRRVVARIVGTVADSVSAPTTTTRLRYSPFRSDAFQTDISDPGNTWSGSDCVRFDSDGSCWTS